MSNFGLATIYLKLALQQTGCPLCRCCTDHETHYIRFLLWESVNDVETRVRLAQSLGFCGRHAQQMLSVEQQDLGMILGNSIIYESLIHLAMLKVRDARSSLRKSLSQEYPWSGLLGRLKIGLPSGSRKAAGFLAAPSRCRVCEVSEETARHYGDVLAEMLSRDEFRNMYDGSDGVCLPHLRMILQYSRQAEGIAFLLARTEMRLEKLEGDLRGLSKKYSVSHRDEPVSTDEGLSAERAIAFLTGSPPRDLEA